MPPRLKQAWAVSACFRAATAPTLIVLLAAVTGVAATACTSVPRSGIVVSAPGATVTVCPGRYEVAIAGPDSAGVSVRASDVTLVLDGVHLTAAPNATGGVPFDGWGVRARGVDGFTLRGGDVSGFRAAVLVEGGTRHSIAGATLSRNRLRGVTGTPTDFLSIWPDFPGQVAADQIGDGVVFINISASSVVNCTATNQQNGIGCFGCTGVRIAGNNCSGVEGWGIHLRRSSGNVIEGNSADHCHPTRSTYCRTVQNNGCDSASLLVIKASNDNHVVGNSLTDGGDGIFSGAVGPYEADCPPNGTDAAHSYCHWGTDRNVYEHNDVRFARALCMESTFAFGNVFRGNRATNCSIAGAWLGYSINATLVDNDLSDSPTGISDQSAVNITVVNNTIARCGVGVFTCQGTFPPTPVFTGATHGYVFENNTIVNSTGIGLDLQDTGRVWMRGNTVAHNAGGNVRFSVSETLSLPPPLSLEGNTILLGGGPFNVDNLQSAAVNATRNWWGTTGRAAIAATLRGAEQMAVLPPNRVAVLQVVFEDGASGGVSSISGEASSGQGGGLTIRRAVNSRADDALDCPGPSPPGTSSLPQGNAQLWIDLGAVDAGCVAGFRFRDVYVPPSARIVSASLLLPSAGSGAGARAGSAPRVRVGVEASDDALAYDSVSRLPSKRTAGKASVPWQPASEPNGTLASPDIAALVQEAVARPGWRSGNALSVLLSPAAAAGAGAKTRATPTGGGGGGGGGSALRVFSFDNEGYSVDPAADSPTEWRHYRRHRFAKIEVVYSYTVAATAEPASGGFAASRPLSSPPEAGVVVLEAELQSDGDNADEAAANQNINFGWQGPNATQPEVGGLVFRNLSLPLRAPGFRVTKCTLVLPTDGPYTANLGMEVRVEAGAWPQPYNASSLPAGRRLLPEAVAFPLANQPWQYTEWHATPNLASLVNAATAQPGWGDGGESTGGGGGAIAFQLVPSAKVAVPQPPSTPTTRRIWGFGRDPRLTPHDFVDAGPEYFEPFLSGPPKAKAAHPVTGGGDRVIESGMSTLNTLSRF